MNAARYPSLTWPWVGLILCLALLGQEYVLLGARPNSSLTVYRLVVMAVGLTSLTLVLLPPRRIAYLVAFGVCAGLIAYALYLQYVDGLEPCPLCVFQRIAVIAMGVFGSNPTGTGGLGRHSLWLSSPWPLVLASVFGK